MYNKHKIACIIPARGGSKGLPGKNIMPLINKPLIAYTIEHAKASKYIDRVIVSTDSKEIADIAKLHGAELPFMRPSELASDASSTLDVLRHAIGWMEEIDKYSFDILVLMHATTPLRTPEDVDNCIEMLVRENADNVISVTDAQRNPYFNMVERRTDGQVKLVKEGVFSTRQSAPQVYDMNSSIYVWWKDLLKEHKGLFLARTRIYVMPKERSIDIDDALDFKIAEMLLRESS